MNEHSTWGLAGQRISASPDGICSKRSARPTVARKDALRRRAWQWQPDIGITLIQRGSWGSPLNLCALCMVFVRLYVGEKYKRPLFRIDSSLLMKANSSVACSPRTQSQHGCCIGRREEGPHLQTWHAF